jgi:flap endonuclease GEN
MTVRYLWKVLEEAGCAATVGSRDFISTPRKVLAVDLSIWISEALSSTAMCTFHSNPAVHLVVQRTVALLKIGVKLVAVLEGKGFQNDDHIVEDQLSDGTNGIRFFAACRSCAEVLSLFGVPVLHAEKKGEALCALLNEQGLVDGVISNDGDCFLYGARNVYTNLTIDSLDQGTIIRYDSSALFAIPSLVEDQVDKERTNLDRKISLSRKDLIAFAILTGSDECSGVPYVGVKKAVKFIYLLKQIYPHSSADAALGEIERWSKTMNDDKTSDDKSVLDTCMNEGINKIENDRAQFSSQEPYALSSAETKFLNSIREKMEGSDACSHVRRILREYLSANNNIIPDGTNLLQKYPKFDELMASPIVMKGKSIENSRDYLQKIVLGLSARLLVLQTNDINGQRKPYYRSFPCHAEVVKPRQIIRQCQHKGYPCYEILWHRGILEFSTLEWQHAFFKAYPALVHAFNETERWGKQQEMKTYRLKIFLGSQYDQNYQTKYADKRKIELALNLPRPRNRKRKRDFRDKVNTESNHLKSSTEAVDSSEDTTFLTTSIRPAMSVMVSKSAGNDLYPRSDFVTPKTSRYIPEDKENNTFDVQAYFENDLITPSNSTNRPHVHDYRVMETVNGGEYDNETSNQIYPHLDDDHVIYCEMGGLSIRISPVRIHP